MASGRRPRSNWLNGSYVVSQPGSGTTRVDFANAIAYNTGYNDIIAGTHGGTLAIK